MNRILFLGSVAAAFVDGAAGMRVLSPAIAATEITPMIINVTDLNGEALGAASATGLRSKTLVSADGATVAVQDGNVPKHLHRDANEVQYILEGTGTIWLGDKEVHVKPGDLVIIPKGTPHGGTTPISGQVKAIAIKTPPQAPDDVKLLD